MESSGLSGRMFGLEMPLQRRSAPSQNPHHYLQQTPTTTAGTAQMVAPQLSSMKQVQQRYQPHASDEEEHGSGNDGESLEGKRKGSSSSSSPWHRMKWTDTMVRLLIMAVYYIGDDPSEPSEKKGKSSSSIAGGEGIAVQQQQQQHKKGKWKNVSHAMMQKGFRVSPQQCEDKFNDLNKRYKRVNDIIGRGTACKVVENQSMLDSMDHISPKLKEEVRKLLNSKHLFFREMCAYHSSCVHAPAPAPDPDPTPVSVLGPAPAPARAPALALPSSLHHQSPPLPEPEDQSNLPNQGQLRQYHDQTRHVGYFEKDEVDDEDQDDGDDIDDDDDDDEEEDDEESFGQSIELSRKRARAEDEGTQLQLQSQFGKGEIMEVLSDASKSVWEKKQWAAARRLQLEEEAIRYEYKAFEIEKQRLKWFKFSTKKQREMDKMKIDNDRKRLENDKMLLLLKRQHLEMHLQQQQPPKPTTNPSDSTENRHHVISNANAPIIVIP